MKTKRGRTLRPLTAKTLGKSELKEYPAGSPCWYQRTPNAPGAFIVWFNVSGKKRPAIYALVNAIDLPTTLIED
jgi:hypothetical protein